MDFETLVGIINKKTIFMKKIFLTIAVAVGFCVAYACSDTACKADECIAPEDSAIVVVDSLIPDEAIDSVKVAPADTIEVVEVEEQIIEPEAE